MNILALFNFSLPLSTERVLLEGALLLLLGRMPPVRGLPLQLPRSVDTTLMTRLKLTSISLTDLLTLASISLIFTSSNTSFSSRSPLMASVCYE